MSLSKEEKQEIKDATKRFKKLGLDPNDAAKRSIKDIQERKERAARFK